MLLTLVIAVELVVSFAALSVLGSEPADRKKMLSRAAPSAPPTSLVAAAPVWIPHRSPLRAQTALNRSPLRLIRPPASGARPAASALPGRGGAAWPPGAGPVRAIPAQSDSRVVFLSRAGRAGHARYRAGDQPPFDPAA